MVDARTRRRVRRAVGLPLAAALVTVAASASASEALVGDHISIYYGDRALWADPAVSRGLEITSGGVTKEVTWPGDPWVQFSVDYVVGGSRRTYYVNAKDLQVTVPTPTIENRSDATTNTIVARWTLGVLEVERTETWPKDGRVVQTVYRLRNTSSQAISNLFILSAFDPDHDGLSTVNRAFDTDGDGRADFAVAIGKTSGWTVGYGGCEGPRQLLGIQRTRSPEVTTPLDAPSTPDSDQTVGFRHQIAALAPGQTAVASHLFVFQTTLTAARALYLASKPALCVSCADADGDGYFAASCGGNDCDDTNAAVNPGAAERCNGRDDNCNGDIDEGASASCTSNVGRACVDAATPAAKCGCASDGDCASGWSCNTATQTCFDPAAPPPPPPPDAEPEASVPDAEPEASVPDAEPEASVPDAEPEASLPDAEPDGDDPLFPDAPPPLDAGVDANFDADLDADLDGGLPVDPLVATDDGCGCRTAGSGSSGGGLALVAGVALAAIVAQRRRRR
jgi:MYXO-CTERM domain-containing protein